jgi:hypothetical protein
LAAVGTIRPAPVAPLGKGKLPAGKCSQITFTAWRNNYDYSCTEPGTPHESTTATGPDLNHCSYSLPVEISHMVVIKATTTIPGQRVVLSYADRSETSPAIWEEAHPVTINWLLKPALLGRAPK